MIDHDAAEKLRIMLSDLQQKAMSHADVEPPPFHGIGGVHFAGGLPARR